MDNTAKLQRLCQSIDALTGLTGIPIYIYTESNALSNDFPCTFCRKMQPEKQTPSGCHEWIHHLLPYVKKSAKGGIFFCPSGFCHVLTSTDLPCSFLLSDAIVCGEPNKSLIEALWTNLFGAPYNNTQSVFQSSFSFLQPKNISNLLRLMLVLSQHDDSFMLMQNYTKALQSLPAYGVANVEILANQMLEDILSQTGLNLVLAGFLCTNILFSYIDSLDPEISPEMNKCFFDPQFIRASSISELKQALTKMLQSIRQIGAQNTQIRQHAVVKQALEFIHAHYHEDITQVAVSNAVFLSPSYFSKVFKEVTGSGFNQYVNEFRVQKAKKLLADPSIHLNAIPSLVGFHHQTYFSKIFHRLTGMSPGKYRSLLLS